MSDDLVQRFVDQELTAEERIQFVARLGRDESLRQRTIDLEQLALQTTQLPRPTVPDGFVASVMGRIEADVPNAYVAPSFSSASDVAPSLSSASDVAPSFSSGTTRTTPWRKLLDAFWAPRAFQWNFGGAAAAFAVLVVAVVVSRSGPTKDAAFGQAELKLGATPTSAELKPGATPTSAELKLGATAPAPTTLVRLMIVQPGAKTVQVAGDFNGWNPAQTSLDQISDGAWAVTIPLKPGRYAYMFVVDGKQWVADPFAAEQKDDGFGARNAVLEVRPADARMGAAL